MRSAAAAAVGVGAAGEAARQVGAGRMLAWRVHAYGSARDLRLEAARVPALRAPDHLLVRVHHSSINPIDLAMIGGYGRRVLNVLRALEAAAGGAASDGPEFPLVPGRDFVGTVERAGAGCSARPGALVWGVVPPHWPGAHAEFVCVRERWTGAAPRALGPAAGGALYAGLTATAALRAAGLAAGTGAARGRRVLLLGLGGVGLAALQLLAVDGAAVVVGAAPELQARALAAGAAAALDRHAADYNERLVAAGPYDAIIDCAGLGGAEASARGWRFSRYVTLSSPLLREADARGLPLGLLTAAARLAAQCASVVCAPTAAPAPAPAAALPPHVRWAYFTPDQGDIELLRRRAENGLWSVCVERVFEWAAADAAYGAASGGHARGKLLLDFTAPLAPAPPAPTTASTPPLQK